MLMATVVPLVGEVVSFDADTGLGVVRAAQGGEWPFHCTRLADGSRSVDAGTRVVFTVVPGAPGRWEADAVVKLS
ncbi:MAG: hypothetical protein NVSMB16_04730 [Acidimicrobiales bacterium]